ncbi:MAG: C4-dicarboxylate ABC transporter [Cellvibrionaceae bacterium]|nr:C4-dicarboxylate ABC transporter [Cellvibrionaceae bacterium]
MSELGFLVVLPSLLAIALAIWTRQVLLSLAAGIWLGAVLLLQNPFAAIANTIERVVAVLGSAGDARVILFTLCVGGLIGLLEANGGVRAFINWLEHKRWAQSPRQAQWLAWILGIVIFIESNITILVAGTTSKPLFDRFKLSRQKLAYLIDSTSAPICILIPFNAWGAFNLGLLSGAGLEQPLTVFMEAILLNFYALFAVALAGLSIAFDWNWGPMAKAEAAAGELPLLELASADNGRPAAAVKPWAMLLPIVVLVLAMPVGLLITGDGQLLAGSGSTSVLWAVLLASLVAALFMRRADKLKIGEAYWRGAGKMLPIALVLMLALALGAVSRELQAGEYIAGLLKANLAQALILPAVFLLAAAVAFAIGSSWGTFALMIPIAVAMSGQVELAPAALVAAVLSGGVFGDHASPISDTTVIASMAAEVDHIDHVRTQLPYALVAGLAALIGFFVLGLVY